MLKIAIIALGSNLQNPAAQIRAALQDIGGHPVIEIRKTSSLYTTSPVGYADQPDFVNAVCVVETALAAEELLEEMQRIETRFGRERHFRNAPRTLDLDIIDYDGQTGNAPHLTLPHPRAHERGFVMVPLAEILPDFRLGGGEAAAVLAGRLGGEGIWLLEETE